MRDLNASSFAAILSPCAVKDKILHLLHSRKGQHDMDVLRGFTLLT